MSFLDNLSKTVGGAAQRLTAKTRRSAALNRIRAVIDVEERAAEKEYLALGRYYYHNLRDTGDPVTEAHCTELDVIETRLDAALKALEAQYSGEPAAVSGEEAEEVTLDDVERFDFDPLQTTEDAKNAVAEAVAAVKEKAAPVMETVKEKAAPAVEAVKEKAAPVIDEIKEKAAPVVETVKEKAAPVVENVKEKAAPVVESVKEKVSGGKKSAQEKARETEAQLYSKIEPKVEQAAEPGENDDLPFEG